MSSTLIEPGQVAAGGPPFFAVRNVSKGFYTHDRKGLLSRRVLTPVLRGVSLAIERGSTTALIGESGSGKSTLGRIVLGLDATDAGAVELDGRAIDPRSFTRDRDLRRTIQWIPQDPKESFNPRLKVVDQLQEALRLGRGRGSKERGVNELLALVKAPVSVLDKYPTSLSGGQAQRLAIARALAMQPSLIVCDEPTSALDASVQAEILNLLQRLQRELGLAYLFISHDLRIVRHLAHTVAVLYRGEILESGPAESVFAAPRHPYTKLLIDSQPGRASRVPPHAHLIGETGVSNGCSFASRCRRADEVCRDSTPEFTSPGGHWGKCHYPLGADGNPV